MAMPFIYRFSSAAIYYALLHSIYTFTVKTDVKHQSNPKNISITASSEEVSEQEAKLINDFQRQAKIPGFVPVRHPKILYASALLKIFSKSLSSVLSPKPIKGCGWRRV